MNIEGNQAVEDFLHWGAVHWPTSSTRSATNAHHRPSSSTASSSRPRWRRS